MTRKETLHTAETCVCGQREEEYGPPENNFEVISDYWEVYLRNRCIGPDGELDVGAEDVANLMALLKIGRITTGNAKEDNYVDACGYMACAAEIATGEDPIHQRMIEDSHVEAEQRETHAERTPNARKRTRSLWRELET